MNKPHSPSSTSLLFNCLFSRISKCSFTFSIALMLKMLYISVISVLFCCETSDKGSEWYTINTLLTLKILREKNISQKLSHSLFSKTSHTNTFKKNTLHSGSQVNVFVEPFFCSHILIIKCLWIITVEKCLFIIHKYLFSYIHFPPFLPSMIINITWQNFSENHIKCWFYFCEQKNLWRFM